MDGEHYPLNRAPEEVAAAQGLECIVANNFMLQLDLDQPGPIYRPIEGRWDDKAHSQVEPIIEEKIGLRAKLTTRSKSGNTHVYMVLDKPVSVGTRIALQAALGSDPSRETLNALRVELGVPIPVVLFETPAEAARVREFLKEYDGEATF